MSDEAFFEKIAEEQRKQEIVLAALQKILDSAPSHSKVSDPGKSSWWKKCRILLAGIRQKNPMFL